MKFYLEKRSFQENGDFLTLKSGKFTYKSLILNCHIKKVMLLNASLVGYITELGCRGKNHWSC